MIKLLKTSKWALTFMSMVALVFIASCGGDDDPAPPPPDPIDPPSALTYAATTVAVGSEGKISATISGDAATFEITDMGDAEDVVAVTVNATTGELTVPMESTTGVYTVEVTATNAEGSTKGTAEITIGINPDFDPTGKGYHWKYFINMSDPWTMTGLNGIPGLPFEEVEIPTGWPAGWPALDPNDWNEQTLFPYLAVGGVADLLFQVPSDIACDAVEQDGDTTYFEVEADLSLTTNCNIDGAAGQSVLIGVSAISYADGEFHWALTQYNQIEITYTVSNPMSETFIDPLDPQDANGTPNQFPAIRGTVEQFTIPTNVFDETGILTSLTVKEVEVILEVVEL